MLSVSTRFIIWRFTILSFSDSRDNWSNIFVAIYLTSKCSDLNHCNTFCKTIAPNGRGKVAVSDADRYPLIIDATDIVVGMSFWMHGSKSRISRYASRPVATSRKHKPISREILSTLEEKSEKSVIWISFFFYLQESHNQHHLKW